MTSRPEPFIQSIFEHLGIYHAACNSIWQDFRPDADIQSFLERRLRDIPRLRSHVMSEVSKPWPSQGDLTALVEKSAGLFIYAFTLVMFH